MIKQFKHIQAHLQTERQHLAQELKLRVNQSADEWQEGAPFGSIEETAIESFELERRIALARRMREQLAEVEYALKRMEKGTYGQCDSCSKPIPLARLEAIPQTNLCFDCKAHQRK